MSDISKEDADLKQEEKEKQLNQPETEKNPESAGPSEGESVPEENDAVNGADSKEGEKLEEGERPEEGEEPEEGERPEDGEEPEEGERPEDGEESENGEEPDGETEEEPEKEIFEIKKKPYHERYYMLYGGETVPETIDPAATGAFLKALGFAENPLQQARTGRDMSALIESSLYETAVNKHYCDFCGVQLTGVEYDVLKDGRERCPTCTKTAIKKEAQFVTLFNDVIDNLELFFNIRFTRNIKVRMVNAKTLHKNLGCSFTPTNDQDPRILGVAIKDRKNQFTIMVENGSPRMEAVKTIAHELTHIWQYQNWKESHIKELYGEHQVIQIYEGMAKWVEVQYCFMLGESGTAKREEILLMSRDDDYGKGFAKFCSVYPLSYDTEYDESSPFDEPDKPL